MEDDLIQPIIVKHLCDEIWDGPNLEQKYNYLVYEFETDLHSYRARSYLDEIDSVAIYGPFLKDSNDTWALESLEIDPRVLAYFRRRYRKVTRFTSDGYKRVR